MKRIIIIVLLISPLLIPISGISQFTERYRPSDTTVVYGHDIECDYVRINRGWKWYAYGDSYTSNTTHYIDHVRTRITFSSFVNRGVGGTNIGDMYRKIVADTVADPNYLSDADVITLMSGVNDYDDDLTLDSVAWYLGAFIEVVYTSAPLSKLYFISTGIQPEATNTAGWNAIDYELIADSVCNIWSVPYINLRKSWGYRVLYNRALFYTTSHPNALGAARLGDIISNRIINGY